MKLAAKHHDLVPTDGNHLLVIHSQTQMSTASAPALRNAVIRLAGYSQDGIQSVGGFLAQLAGSTAQDVMTYMTIPSTISGRRRSSRSPR